MPSGLGDINVRIGAVFKDLEVAFNKVERVLNRKARTFENVGRGLSASLTAPLVAVGAAAVNTFAGIDKLKNGIQAITNDVDLTEKQFQSLIDTVKDTRTTLDLQGATTAALQLQGVGIEGEKAINIIKQFGIAATLSGAGADNIGEIGRQLAQASAKGVILQEELSVIIERLPALAGVINKEFGTVTADGLSDAGVSADQFISRLTKAIEQNERFQNVQGGLSKQLETFKLNLQLAGNELGKTVANALNLEENLGVLSGRISELVEGFANLPERTQRFIVRLGGVLAAIGPLNLAIAQFIKFRLAFVSAAAAMTGSLKNLSTGILNAGAAFQKFDAVTKATTIGVLAIAVAGLAAVFLEVKRNIDVATRASRDLSQIQEDTNKQVIEQTSLTGALVDILKDENSTREEKQRALTQLQQFNPQYFGSLDVEKSKIEDITAAFDNYRESITLATRERVAFAKLEEVETRILELRNRFEDAAESSNKFGNILLQSVTGGAGRAGVELSAITAELKALEEERTKILDLIEKTNREISTFGAPQADTTPTPSTGGAAPAAAVSDDVINRIRIPADVIDSDLSIRLETLKDNLKEVENGFDQLKPKIEELPAAGDPLTNFLAAVDEKLADIGIRGRVLGQEDLVVLKDQFDLLQASLVDAAVNFGLNSEAVEELKERIAALGLEVSKTKDLQDKMTAATAKGISIFGDYVSQAISGQRSVADAFKAAGIQIINVLLSTAIAHVLEESFKNFPPPIAAAIGAASAGIVTATFSSLVGLQEGGIIPPGFPNDTFFARLSSGEAVIPLDRLNEFTQPSDQALTVNGLIRGSNIHLANEKTARRQSRIGG